MSKALELADRLESGSEGCDCFALSRIDCGCPDAIWPEDFMREAARELRRLHGVNGDLLEALIDMVQAYSELIPRDQIPPSRGRQAIRKASSAINKAKGETE